jgi:arsenite/tail-anchored protein-transporting ATPase
MSGFGLLESSTRFIFFTGKGGVGKTSIACATAIALADRGKRVLLVSTDPASNLGQVLEYPVSADITAVPGVPGLSAVNIEPQAAARAYRDRIMAPMRKSSARSLLPQVEEQLSGACTTEIAAFDEFTRLLTDPARIGTFDHVIFDTAPSGHTLRLLQLPAAWTSFIEDNPRGASCLGPLSGLEAQRTQYADTVTRLTDASVTTLVLVSRPDTLALAEAERTSSELAALGINAQRLVVNGVFKATDRSDTIATAMERRGSAAMQAMPERLRVLPRDLLDLRAHNIVGIEALRTFLSDIPTVTLAPTRAPNTPVPLPPSLMSLVVEIAEQEGGLIMVMGKGGVGKTTVAAALASELAARGHRVHLSTTDPAAHLAQTLGDSTDGLTVSRIDPAAETERYIDRALATKGKQLDDEGRRLLLEDLRSPCTEEVAVFHAFSRIVNQARREFVVLDTAPTGHTLLLLDTAGSYHREVLRNSTIPAERITTPLMRLQDKAYTKILLVTLPETTPVLEATELQEDLRRAEVEPFAWVINQSLSAANVSDPLLRARAVTEQPLIERVTRLAARTSIIPFQSSNPVGRQALRNLVRHAPADHVDQRDAVNVG